MRRTFLKASLAALVVASGVVSLPLTSEAATRGGKMQITKLDQVMADIPGDWYWVKRETTRILLETLRDFTYDTGDASFWYLNDEGNLKLTLRGPSGSRNIDVVLHGAEDRKP